MRKCIKCVVFHSSTENRFSVANVRLNWIRETRPFSSPSSSASEYSEATGIESERAVISRRGSPWKERNTCNYWLEFQRVVVLLPRPIVGWFNGLHGINRYRRCICGWILKSILTGNRFLMFPSAFSSSSSCGGAFNRRTRHPLQKENYQTVLQPSPIYPAPRKVDFRGQTGSCASSVHRRRPTRYNHKISI